MEVIYTLDFLLYSYLYNLVGNLIPIFLSDTFDTICKYRKIRFFFIYQKYIDLLLTIHDTKNLNIKTYFTYFLLSVGRKPKNLTLHKTSLISYSLFLFLVKHGRINETIEYFPNFDQTLIPTLMTPLAIIYGCVRYSKRRHILKADGKSNKNRHAILVLACFDGNLY